MSADDLAHPYWAVMTDLLDRHCPVVKVRRKAKPVTPWFDADSVSIKPGDVHKQLKEGLRRNVLTLIEVAGSLV